MIRRPLPRRSLIRRSGILAVLAAALLALSACAGLPTSGPVNPGVAPGAVAPPEFAFAPQKPQDGASPLQIVQGFVDAGSGPEGDWATAKLYLAPAFRSKWNPRANVTIDDRSLRQYSSPTDERVTLEVAPTANVDGTGVYGLASGGQTPLSYSLAKVDGQWRITDAPKGIVLGSDQFGSVFRQYELMYFDPTWTYLVPDVRWFPSTNAATQISKELIDGKPSPWLAGSVVSAFPDSVSLDVPSVPVPVNGIAQVAVTGGVLSAPQVTLDRMQTQLVASLATAGISDAQMTFDGAPLTANTITTASTRIPSQPLVMTAKGFGLLSGGGSLEPIPGISDAVARLDPTAIELSGDQNVAAVRVASGQVERVPAKGPTTVLDRRSSLISPVIDPEGYIWSVPADSPSALTAYSPTGAAAPIAGAWTEASRIVAMAMSRDGTRLAAVVNDGAQYVVEVAGVVRSSEGVPQSLGQPVVLATLPGAGVDVTWLDDTSISVLAHGAQGGVQLEQSVSGPTTSTPTPGDATTIAGSSTTAVRIRTVDGTLSQQRGSNWEQAGTGILVLATAQGSP